MRILFLGDSLTYGFAMPREQAWPALCAGQAGLQGINLAVNGNTTGGMLAALPRALEIHAPDLVFLMGGANDIFYGGDLAGAQANLGGLIHLAVAAGAQPILGIPPSPKLPVRPDWASLLPKNAKELMECYLNWLRRFAGVFRLPLLDFCRELPRRAAAAGLVPGDCYLEDGLHPSREGHRIMAGLATEMILALLDGRRC